MSDGLKKAGAVLLILLFILAVFPFWQSSDVGYTAPTELKDYGISGREDTWSFTEFLDVTPESVAKITVSRDIVEAYLDKIYREENRFWTSEDPEDIKIFLETIDELTTVVDQRTRKSEFRYTGDWVPYEFIFELKDGSSKQVGISVLREISRVMCYDETYYELVSPEDFYTQMERACDIPFFNN